MSIETPIFGKYPTKVMPELFKGLKLRQSYYKSKPSTTPVR